MYNNGIEGFWSFAKERLLKYHGVDAEKFPLYLKELEYRYNHRDRDLFDDLIQVLVGYNRVAILSNYLKILTINCVLLKKILRISHENA